MGGNTSQQIDPLLIGARLDADSHPDVLGPGKRGGDVGEAFCSLRQHLERMPVCSAHGLEDRNNEFQRNAVVKQVAHRVHEHQARTAPAQRLTKRFVYQLHLTGPTRSSLAYRRQPFVGGAGPAEPVGHPFCVAVLAAWGHTRAAAYWVPGSLGPLNGRDRAHRFASSPTRVLGPWCRGDCTSAHDPLQGENAPRRPLPLRDRPRGFDTSCDSCDPQCGSTLPLPPPSIRARGVPSRWTTPAGMPAARTRRSRLVRGLVGSVDIRRWGAGEKFD